MTEAQIARDILAVRPSAFGSNSQTAASNHFQHIERSLTTGQVRSLAESEFDCLTDTLRDAGVAVHESRDTAHSPTPDALFPNNWISFHADGTVVLYPMLAENRRLERRPDILDSVSQHFRIRRVVDLTGHELAGCYLEGTGSLVLDRVNHTAYACLSPRTNLEALGDFAQQLDYELVCFDAIGRDGTPVYHTNVVMSLGRTFAVICLESIATSQRSAVVASLASSSHEIIDISLAQVESFAGNILELATNNGGSLLVMSAAARASFALEQIAALQRHVGSIVTAPIPTIERIGGGSVRCMLAEIHLPRSGA
jgi:hypothetical protein